MPNADRPNEVLRSPTGFPSESAQVVIPGPCGDLEALTDVPAPDDERAATAIICHPVGDGGTMHNKVVHIVERAFRELGARTVRFNFRGVGGSQGDYDQGFGECDDLLAVAEWVRGVRQGDELWLGGYGFGAYVAIRACQKLSVTQLVVVAPPVEDYDFAALPRPSCPWMVIQGDADARVNPDAVYKWIEEMDDPPQLLRMEDADHTFHRRLMDLRGAIKNGIRRQRRDDESASE